MSDANLIWLISIWVSGFVAGVGTCCFLLATTLQKKGKSHGATRVGGRL